MYYFRFYLGDNEYCLQGERQRHLRNALQAFLVSRQRTMKQIEPIEFYYAEGLLYKLDLPIKDIIDEKYLRQ